MAVKITLTNVGASISDPLAVYYSVDGVIWIWEANVAKATLIAGYSIDQPTAVAYQVRSVGDCQTILTLACTTSTTTTIPLVCYSAIFTNTSNFSIVLRYNDCNNNPQALTLSSHQGQRLCYYSYIPNDDISIGSIIGCSEDPCLRFQLTSDEFIDSTFDMIYCDDTVENITVPANHVQIHCAKNVLNPSGGSPFVDIIGECTTTSTTTIPPTTTTTTTEGTTTTTTTVAPTTTTTTTEEGTTTTTTTELT